MTEAPTIADLRQRVNRMQGAAVTRQLSPLPGLSDLVSLHTGMVCCLDSPGLAMSLMAGPSGAGDWTAVVGVPDPVWGEVGVAVCVPREGVGLSETDLLAWLDGKVARYKMPKRAFVWDAMPKSAYGKVTKKMLREALEVRGCLAPDRPAPDRPAPDRLGVPA